MGLFLFRKPKMAIEFQKDITLEDHIAHASSHLARASRHIAAVKEHHGEIGGYAGITKADAAANAQNPHVIHHGMKAAENLGRAHEQQTMAVRHTNALTGNAQYGGNALYKKGDGLTQEVGGHLAQAGDHLDSLVTHAVAPAGETDAGAKDRKILAAHHHGKIAEHLGSALEKIDGAKSAFDASLNPEAAQEGGGGSRNIGNSPINQMEASGDLRLVEQVPEHLLSLTKDDAGAILWWEAVTPIMKFEKGELAVGDGEAKIPGLWVKGWAAVSEYRDSQGDIIDEEGLRKAAAVWDKWGKSRNGKGANLREMHEAKAVGIIPVIQIREHPVTKTAAMWIESFVVADETIKKVQAGILRAFSIGGRCKKRVLEPVAEAA